MEKCQKHSAHTHAIAWLGIIQQRIGRMASGEADWVCLIKTYSFLNCKPIRSSKSLCLCMDFSLQARKNEALLFLPSTIFIHIVSFQWRPTWQKTLSINIYELCSFSSYILQSASLVRADEFLHVCDWNRLRKEKKIKTVTCLFEYLERVRSSE